MATAMIKQENPWDVSNIDEFLYYCCPECDTKQKTKSDFITHAIDAHGQLFIEDAAQSHEQAKIVPLYLDNFFHILVEIDRAWVMIISSLALCSTLI